MIAEPAKSNGSQRLLPFVHPPVGTAAMVFVSAAPGLVYIWRVHMRKLGIYVLEELPPVKKTSLGSSVWPSAVLLPSADL